MRNHWRQAYITRWSEPADFAMMILESVKMGERSSLPRQGERAAVHKYGKLGGTQRTER